MPYSFKNLFIVLILSGMFALFAAQPKNAPESPSVNTSVEKTVSHSSSAAPIREKIVLFATELLGAPYKVAGSDPSGFDCSGFVHYVFNEYDIALPRSSRYMAQEGVEVLPEEAEAGDLIFFTGTDPASTTVGHVGIIVSGKGEEIKFIHSSSGTSAPYVKYDLLSKPGYQRRFLTIKRVL